MQFIDLYSLFIFLASHILYIFSFTMYMPTIYFLTFSHSLHTLVHYESLLFIFLHFLILYIFSFTMYPYYLFSYILYIFSFTIHPHYLFSYILSFSVYSALTYMHTGIKSSLSFYLLKTI